MLEYILRSIDYYVEGKTANREVCCKGKEKTLPKIDEDENSNMLLAYCVKHREISVSKVSQLFLMMYYMQL